MALTMKSANADGPILIENYGLCDNTMNTNSIIGKLLSFRLEDTFYIFFPFSSWKVVDLISLEH